MVGVTAESPLAFSLWRKARGWAWRVCDLDGMEVAAGATETREEAEDAISAIYLNPPGRTPAAA